MGMNIRKKLRREEGAAAVEFALIVGLLAMLVFGLLEYGLAFWQVQNLRAAAREGARVAAVGGDNAAVSDAMVGASAGSLDPGFSGFSMSTFCDGTTDTIGDPVEVTINNSALKDSVKEAFKVSIPLLPSFTLNPELSGTFRCE
jgi:Flp pilus assembly protein TadG